MSGTTSGGKAAAATNKRLYGKNFYKKIGEKGGKISRGGGFADTPLGHERAVEAGRRGGKWSPDYTEEEWSQKLDEMRKGQWS